MNIDILGYAFDLAANQIGAASGPNTLQKSPYLKLPNLHWVEILKPPANLTGRQRAALEAVHTLCKELALQTLHRTQQHQPFLTIGGDHSCAIGTWSGAANGLKGPLGLIWIDAHMDAHTFETSTTMNIHGMPLAALLGYGDKKLTKLQGDETALSPKNLVLIGTRSFEREEMNLLKSLNVRIYFMKEIKERGLNSILLESVKHVSKNTTGFGISIDIDAIDPSEAPGVSTPERNGLHLDELLDALPIVPKQQNFIGAEIAEFNPKKDSHHQSEKIIAKIIQTLYPPP